MAGCNRFLPNFSVSVSTTANILNVVILYHVWKWIIGDCSRSVSTVYCLVSTIEPICDRFTSLPVTAKDPWPIITNWVRWYTYSCIDIQCSWFLPVASLYSLIASIVNLPLVSDEWDKSFVRDFALSMNLRCIVFMSIIALYFEECWRNDFKRRVRRLPWSTTM